MLLTKIFKFEAAHHLPNYDGDCHKLHGHTYQLDVTISGVVKADGFVLDFKKMKRIISDKVISQFDHSYINEYIENPTAENIIIKIWNLLDKEFKQENVLLYRLRVSAK